MRAKNGGTQMITEAKTQTRKAFSPSELATMLPSISLDEKALSAASSASTDYWTGNWNDSDSVSD